MKEHDNSDKKIKFTSSNAKTVRLIDTHKSDIQEGTGTNYAHLADEKYFKNYWHLLPPNRCRIAYTHGYCWYGTCVLYISWYFSWYDCTILSDKGKDLHTQVSNLANANGLRAKPQDPDTQKEQLKEDLKKLATTLKEAVGASVSAGLQKALSQLNGASGDALIVEKALDVIKHYDEVVSAYEDVKEKKTQYTNALGGSSGEYDQVESEFGKLENAYNLGKCKAITLIFDKPCLVIKTSIFHTNKLKNSDLLTKASTLKSTATTQSTSELSSTDKTDLVESTYNPQDRLEGKAQELKNKAQELHTVAETLESAAKAATGPLATLKATATLLKEAAKGSSGNSLYEKAQELEQAAQKNQPAQDQANAVIQAFDNVDTHYTKLMNAYNGILKKPEEAAKLTEGDNPNVINVVKAYHGVKTTYYQMIITYRIQKKAHAFYEAANALKTAAQQAAQPSANPLLAALHTDAQGEMQQLVEAANALQSIALGTAQDSNIVQYYLAVFDAYEKLSTKPEFKEALEAKQPEVNKVKEAINPLMKSYENVLKLRVQELVTKADTLKNKATQLSSDPPALTREATLLATAASKGPSEGLKEKATALVTAIKGASGGTNDDAKQVIDQFEAVRTKYNELEDKQEYKTKLKSALDKIEKGEVQSLTGTNDEKVKDVNDAYTALKDLYDKILNFAKLEKITQELYTAAQELAGTSGDADKVIINFNAVAAAYKALGDNKPIVNADLDNLKTVYSNAIYFYNKCIIKQPSIVTNWTNSITYLVIGTEPGPCGCEGVATPKTINSVKLALSTSGGLTHTVTLNPGSGGTGTVTYKSKAINLGTGNNGTIIINIPGGEIKLKDLSISGSNQLTITGGISKVSVIKKTNPWGECEKIKIKSATLTTTSDKTLTLVKETSGSGQAEAQITGSGGQGNVALNYISGTIDITISGSAISGLRKYEPPLSPTYFDGVNTFRFQKWTQYEAGKFYLFLSILMVIKISLFAIFIYSLHYKESHISRSIINQPKMSTFLSIVFYMCHEILLALGFAGVIGNNGGTFVVLPAQYVGPVFMMLLAYKDKGGYPPKDKNQADCVTLKLETTPESIPTSVTYTVGPDYGNPEVFGAHIEAKGSGSSPCNYKGTYYYLYLIPPSIMVIVGMGLPLPNFTIVATVLRFVIDMEFLFIVLGTLETAGESITTSIDGETKAGCCETTLETNSRITGEC